MLMAEKFDVSTLNWVKGEIDETLKQARVSLESYVDNTADDAQIRFCVAYLHQVRGTLQMVELFGAAQVAQEMEHLATAIQDQKITDAQPAYELLMRSVLLLPDYLETLQAGQPDSPVVLLPLINELRNAYSEKPLTEAGIFKPDFNVAPPARPANAAAVNMRALAHKLYPYYHNSLVKISKNTDLANSIKTIATVIEKLLVPASRHEVRQWLWIASAYVEGLRGRAIRFDNAAKQLLLKIDQLIKALVSLDETGMKVEHLHGLNRFLLFQLGKGEAKGPRVIAVRKAFQLETLLPDEETLQKTRETMSGFNSGLKKTVSSDVMEELSRVKDALDLFVRSDLSNMSHLETIAASLENMSHTLSLLRQDALKQTILEQSVVVKNLLSGEEKATDLVLMGVAAAVLAVESALKDWGGVMPVEQADDVEEQVSETSHLPQVEAEHRRVIRQVMKEAKDDLVKLREGINTYLENPAASSASLEEMPLRLHQIVGSLTLLSYRRVAQVVRACGFFIIRDLADDSRRTDDKLDALADALMSIEYYLEAFVESRVHPASVLEVAERAVANLGYPVESLPAEELVQTDKTEDADEGADEIALAAEQGAAISDDSAAMVSAKPTEVAVAPESPPVVAEVTSAAVVSEEAQPQAQAVDEAEHEQAVVEEEAVAIHAEEKQVESTPPAVEEDDGDELDDEIIEIFIEEAEEVLENIGEFLPAWKANQGNEEALTDLRRAFHTLKGSGRLVGAKVLGEFAWAFESLLNKVIDKTVTPSHAMFDLLDQTYAALPELIQQFKDGTPPTTDYEFLQEAAEDFATPGGMSEAEEGSKKKSETVVGDSREPATVAPSVQSSIEEITSVPIIDPVLLDIYANEVESHLGVLGDLVIACREQGLCRVEEPIVRALHTLQGSSRMADVKDVAELSAGLEKFAKNVQVSHSPLEPDAIDITEDYIAFCKQELEYLQDPLQLPRPDKQDLQRRVDALLTGGDTSAHVSPEAGLASKPELDEVDTTSDLEELSEEIAAVSGEGGHQEEADDGQAAAELGDEIELVDTVDMEVAAPEETDEVVDESEALAEDSLDIDALFAGAGFAGSTESEESGESVTDPHLEVKHGDLTHLDELTEGEPTGPAFVEELESTVSEALAEETTAEEEDIASAGETVDEVEATSAVDELLAFDFSTSGNEVEAESLGRKADAMMEEHGIGGEFESAGLSEDDLSETQIEAEEIELQPADVGIEDVSEPAPSAEDDFFEPTGEIESDETPENIEISALIDVSEQGSPADEIDANELAELFEPGETEPKDSFEPAIEDESEPFAEPGVEAEFNDTLDLSVIDETGIDHAVVDEQEFVVEFESAPTEEVMLASAEGQVDDIHTLDEVELADVTEGDEALAGTPLEAEFGADAAVEDGAIDIYSSADFDEDVVDIFLEEGVEILDASEETLQEWVDNPQDRDLVTSLQRQLHTLKGGARMAGIAPVGDLCHSFETVLGAVADGLIERSREMTSLLQLTHDRLVIMLEQVRNREPLTGGSDLIQRVDALARHTETSEEIEVLDTESAIDFTSEHFIGSQEEAEEAAPVVEITLTEEPASLSEEVTAEPVVDASKPETQLVEEASREAVLETFELEDVDPDVLEIFLEEGQEILDASEETLQSWVDNPDDRNLVTVLQRQLHTLKGGARMAGITPVGDLSHSLETVLGAVVDGILDRSREMFTLLQLTHDRLVQMLEQVKNHEPIVTGGDLIARVNALADQTEGGAEETETEEKAQPESYAESSSTLTALGEEAEVDEHGDKSFIDIATDWLHTLQRDVKHWHQDKDNLSLVDEMVSSVQALVRASQKEDVIEITELAQALCDLMRNVVDGHVPVADEMFRLIQLSDARLEEMFRHLRINAPIPNGRYLITSIEEFVTASRKANEPESEEILIPPTPLPLDAKNTAVAASAAPASAPAMSASEASKVAEEKAAVENARNRRRSARVQQELVRVGADMLDNLVGFAGEVSIYRSRVEQQFGSLRFNLNEFEQTIERLRGQIRQFDIETEAQIQSRREEINVAHIEEDAHFDPLEFDRFTTMQQLSRSMMESLSDLTSIESMISEIARESETLLLQQSRVNTELQEGLMHTRMMPLVENAPRLRRLVRQVSTELGKQVEIRFQGAEVEMDRNAVNRIMAPLEHLLRNAIGHGLESPEERRAAGKSEGGTIIIAQSRERSEIVIRLSDDGAGVDLDKVRNKAIERGLMRPDADLTDKEIMHFILESGFSTADALTQVSGRGVGMDVVGSEIKQLGGALEIDSVRGQGTTFTIRLPLMMSVSRSLLVNIGEDIYAIPLLSIVGIERIPRARLNELLEGEDASYTWLNTEFSLLNLRTILGVTHEHIIAEDDKYPLLLTQTGDHRVALAVDGLIGSREVVIKSLGPQLSKVNGLSGATVLADGKVSLILDLPSLIRTGLAQRGRQAEEVVVEAAAPAKRKREGAATVMVVDDSITVRKVSERMLKRNRLNSVVAKDGVEALALLEEVMPDVMLLDIEMPRMDGYELATHIRNSDRLKHIPIIMITSRTGDKHRQRAMDIGVNVYLGKPFQEADLLEQIRKLLAEDE